LNVTNGDVPQSQSNIYEILESFEEVFKTIYNYEWPTYRPEEFRASLDQARDVWNQNTIADFVNIM
jgi:hypothetical protein